MAALQKRNQIVYSVKKHDGEVGSQREEMQVGRRRASRR